MEQSEDSLDSTSDYLCGFCPERFSISDLVRHLMEEHISKLDAKHEHSLWCSWCSPLLRSNNDSDDQEDGGPRNGERNDGASVNEYNSNLVSDQDPSTSAATSDYYSGNLGATGECFMYGSFMASVWDTVYYNATDFLHSLNETRCNFITLRGPRYRANVTDASCLNPSIDIVPLNSPTNEIFPPDTTNLQSLSATANAEIPRELNITYAEALPESANSEIPNGGQSAHIEPLPETVNEITCNEQLAHTEPLPETPNDEINCSEQSACIEPLPETANAEIPCNGQSSYTEPLPETPNAEITCSGQSAYIEPLPETAHSETYCSEQVPFVEFRIQDTDSESRLSESLDDKSRADVCHSSCSPKVPNCGSSADTLNSSGTKVSSQKSVLDNSRGNSIVSGISRTDSNGKLSYAAALRRGLRNRRCHLP